MFTGYPDGLWQRIWPNSPNAPQPRNSPPRRPVGIFHNRDALVRLVSAVLAK